MSSSSNIFQMLFFCSLLNVNGFQRLESTHWNTKAGGRASHCSPREVPSWRCVDSSSFHVTILLICICDSWQFDSCATVQQHFPKKNTADKACGFKTCNSSAFNKSFLTPTWSPKAIWNSVSHSRWNLLCDMCGSGGKGASGLSIWQQDWQHWIEHYLSTTELWKMVLSLMAFSSIETCWPLLKMTDLGSCARSFVLGRSRSHLNWTERRRKGKINPANICLRYDMANNTQMERKEPCTSKCQRFKDMELNRNKMCFLFNHHQKTPKDHTYGHISEKQKASYIGIINRYWWQKMKTTIWWIWMV